MPNMITTIQKEQQKSKFSSYAYGKKKNER